MQQRLDKYPVNPERDARHVQSVAALWQAYEVHLEKMRKAGATDPRLTDFRWQLEELRVSLFAQELRTPYPVSFKRLDRLWHAICSQPAAGP